MDCHRTCLPRSNARSPRRRKQGVDVISLGIGDPDMPTPAHIVEEMQRQVADPANHQYPNNKGLDEFREAVATFYKSRFGVDLDPETEVFPLLGAKEGIAHICFSFLDEGDVCLGADPGYPVYASGPILAGGDAGAHAAQAGAGLPARSRGDRRRHAQARQACSSSIIPTIPPAPSSRTISSSG